MTTSTAEEFLSTIGIDVAKVDANEDRQVRRGRTDKRVCICGHGVSRHTVLAQGVLCEPTKTPCRCHEIDPVIEVSDIRYFLRKTSGPSELHALIRGIRAMSESEEKTGIKATVNKLRPWVCVFCDSEEGTNPYPLTKEGRRNFEGTSEGYDKFVCAACREKLK